jgi:hypothetical protein
VLPRALVLPWRRDLETVRHRAEGIPSAGGFTFRRKLRYLRHAGMESMQASGKPLRTAKYLLRFTPEEKAELEQKVRLAAADGNRSLSLADALREGAQNYLDDLLGSPGPDARPVETRRH